MLFFYERHEYIYLYIGRCFQCKMQIHSFSVVNQLVRSRESYIVSLTTQQNHIATRARRIHKLLSCRKTRKYLFSATIHTVRIGQRLFTIVASRLCCHQKKKKNEENPHHLIWNQSQMKLRCAFSGDLKTEIKRKQKKYVIVTLLLDLSYHQMTQI